jgi:tRNA nucleotidyltransferase (CCA-adding enzyme)
VADLLVRLDKKLVKLVAQSGKLAGQLGYRAYLVGGPVRDLVLRRENLDLDITIEGQGMRVAEAFAANHQGSSIVCYPAFKTATVTMADGQLLDFATARSETYSQGGVFPKVTPSNLIEDLFRRDFTINAMAIAINPESWGKVIDPFEGMADLKARKIRILYEQSFLDDPTRILRAARFKARLKFTMDRQTLKILKDSVKSKALETIKPQRYVKELNKILKEENSKEAIKDLKSWNAYQACLTAGREE